MNMSTAFNCFLAKIRYVGGIPFALTRKSRRQRLVEAYNEAKAEVNAPDVRFCDNPAKLKEFLSAT